MSSRVSNTYLILSLLKEKPYYKVKYIHIEIERKRRYSMYTTNIYPKFIISRQNSPEMR